MFFRDFLVTSNSIFFFVIFSKFWEYLYKICAILYRIYSKFFKNLEESQNLNKIFSKRLKFFSKFQQIFKTEQSKKKICNIFSIVF